MRKKKRPRVYIRGLYLIKRKVMTLTAHQDIFNALLNIHTYDNVNIIRNNKPFMSNVLPIFFKPDIFSDIEFTVLEQLVKDIKKLSI
jgi:hypothetical protein